MLLVCVYVKTLWCFATEYMYDMPSPIVKNCHKSPMDIFLLGVEVWYGCFTYLIEIICTD